MKKISDLIEGDIIWVKCPYYINNPEDGEWRQEKITKVEVGEDMYKGSGRWFRRIYTDNSVINCPNDLCDKGKHWPILYLNWGSNESNDYIFEANPTRSAIFKIS